MATRAQVTKLAVFLLLIVSLAVGLVALLVGTAFWQERATYYVRIPESAYGLEGGAAVTLHGVRIGSVTALELTEDSTEVHVALAVDPKVRIRSDAEAVLKYKGLTGLKLIDIVGGSVRAEVLQPGSHIRYGRSTTDVLAERADELATQAARAFEQASELAEQLSALLDQFDAERAGALLGRTEQLLSNLDRSAVELHQLLKETRQPLTDVVADVGGAARRADTVLAGAENVLEGLDILIWDVRGVVRGNGDDLRSTTQNLRQASQYLEELARRLRERPSRILFERPPKERDLP